MANNTSGGNRINVPQAKGALDNLKYEIARELGVNLKQGYNGDLTSREAGYVGGYMEYASSTLPFGLPIFINVIT